MDVGMLRLGIFESSRDIEAVAAAGYFFPVSADASFARYFSGVRRNFFPQGLQQNITVRSGWPACL
jgi:hypothetical protein